MAPRSDSQRVCDVIRDLLLSQQQLVHALRQAPATKKSKVNFKLLDRSRTFGAAMVREIELGELRISRWVPPTDDELSDLIGDDECER